MTHLLADLLFILVGLLIVFFCVKRGFFKTLMRFCRFLLALLAAYFFGSRVAAWLLVHISALSSWRVASIVGYLLVFLIALVVLILVTKVIGDLIHQLPLLNFIDRFLGGVVGVLIAFCVLLLIASVIRSFWGDAGFYVNSSVIRFFGNIKLPKVLSFLDFKSFISKMVQSFYNQSL